MCREVSYRTAFDESMLDRYNDAILDRTFAIEHLLGFTPNSETHTRRNER
jgi:hypothetical protein